MDFSNQKVAVLGLGIEGVSLCQYLASKKALITGFDIKTQKELGETYQDLKKLGINFRLGKKWLQKGLFAFDYIFRSPGVKPNLPELVEARKAKIPVSSETKLFFKLCPARIIGVTGTKGKGTTSTLIYKILKKSEKKAFLLGNIGVPRLKFLPQLDQQSWVVLELSSFQLQDLTVSPHIAVVLFITSEHLDYHRSQREYIKAKMPIVKFQSKKDFAVLNKDNKVSTSFASLTGAKVYYFSRFQKAKGAYISDKKEIILSVDKKKVALGKTKDLQLMGEHNWENVTAAVTAASLAGANQGAIKKVVFSFAGLEHRLELVAEIEGIKFYNDSFSTTPETAIAAIKSFSKPVVLIAGGSEKRSDFTKLGKEIAESSVKILILIGEMTKRIETAAQKAGFNGQIIKGLKTMEEVVKTAVRFSRPGGVVLLSPACASFDMFKDYKDRGDQFKAQVLALN